VLNFLGNSAPPLTPYVYQSVYGRAAVTVSGSAKIGLEYAHPLKQRAIGKMKFLVSVDF